MAKAPKKTTKPAAPKDGKKAGDKAPPGRKQRAATDAGTLNGAGIGPGHNSDAAVQASFLSHRSKWISCLGRLKIAEKELREMVADAKSEGFQKKQFQIADMLAGSAKKEAKVVADVTVRLQVARWIGHAMGKQFDLFENQPVAKYTIDDAYEAGKRACMSSESATPPEQFSVQELSQAWLKGYHDETARRVSTGIKPLEQTGTTDSPWVGPGTKDDAPVAGWGASRLPAAAQSGAEF